MFPQKIVGTPAEEFGHSLRQRQICLHGHPIEQSENITETALWLSRAKKNDHRKDHLTC